MTSFEIQMVQKGDDIFSRYEAGTCRSRRLDHKFISESELRWINKRQRDQERANKSLLIAAKEREK